MIGGGFLGQSQKTANENRDRLRDALGKKKVTKTLAEIQPNIGSTDDGKELSESDRQALITEILKQDRIEMRRKILKIVLILSGTVAAVIYLKLSVMR